MAKHKKKKSKITTLNDGMKNEYTQAFRCDEAMNNLLDGIPNKSELIRNAVEAYMGNVPMKTCPECEGRGKVPFKASKVQLKSIS